MFTEDPNSSIKQRSSLKGLAAPGAANNRRSTQQVKNNFALPTSFHNCEDCGSFYVNVNRWPLRFINLKFNFLRVLTKSVLLNFRLALSV